MAKKSGTIRILSDSEITKKYGNVRASDIIIDSDRTLRIPSRSIWLNHQMGGGLCYGRIHEVFGYESTGKSLMAMDFGYATQALGGVVLYGDIERAFDYYWAEQNGLDLDKLFVFENNGVEAFGDWARDMCIYWRNKLTNNEPILLVADSIAAFETQLNINKDMVNSKAQMGNRAKAIYDFYRTRNDLFADLGITVYMINQVRDKVGASMYESAITTPGGGSTKFYSSIRLSLTRSTQIKGRVVKGVFEEDKGPKGKKIGQNIIVGVEKNKTAPPRGRIKTQVYFTDAMYDYVGYSRYEGLQDILIDHDILIKKGNAYYYKFKKEMRKLCGKYDDITKTLEEDERARRILIKKLGVNTIGGTREKLETLTKNLFPIKAKSVKAAETLSSDE